jgi:hypothetical protein
MIIKYCESYWINLTLTMLTFLNGLAHFLFLGLYIINLGISWWNLKLVFKQYRAMPKCADMPGSVLVTRGNQFLHSKQSKNIEYHIKVEYCILHVVSQNRVSGFQPIYCNKTILLLLMFLRFLCHLYNKYYLTNRYNTCAHHYRNSLYVKVNNYLKLTQEKKYSC